VALGLTSYAYRWSLQIAAAEEPAAACRQLLSLAARHHFDAVQVCDNLRFWQMSDRQLDRLGEEAREIGLALEAGIRGTAPDVFLAALSACGRIDSNLLRTVVEIDRGADIRPQLDRTVEDLRAVLPAVAKAGVRVAVENHSSLTSEELLYVLQKADHPSIGACIDTMNSVVLLERPLETVRALAPYAHSVHLKDFRVIRKPEHFLIEGTAVGEGSVDFPAVMEAIRAAGRAPSYHVELYVGRGEPDPLTHEDELIARSARYSKQRLSL